MSFIDPEGEYGGIRFKNPIKKQGGYQPTEKFSELPNSLKQKIALKTFEMQKVVREAEYFKNITHDEIDK
jgi:hypothetical protein